MIKQYQCTCCGFSKKIYTNHSEGCWAVCPNCSWKGVNYDKTNNSIFFEKSINRWFVLYTENE